MQDLGLTVQVPADEWAYVSRRCAYLEALLLRLVRDRHAVKEWYDAGELAALRLPGLPPSRSGISAKATREGWQRQPARAARGQRVVFHVTALPPRAFDALLSRLIDLPPVDPDTGGAMFALPPAPVPAMPLPVNTAPPWVLPLMRLMRGESAGDLAHAWRALPAHLPEGVTLPEMREAAKVLARLRLF